MDRVIVELLSFGQAKEYRTVSLTEAREILARKMAPGHVWHIPTWQFEDGSFSRDVLELQRQAYAAVK